MSSILLFSFRVCLFKKIKEAWSSSHAAGVHCYGRNTDDQAPCPTDPQGLRSERKVEFAMPEASE